MTDLALGVLSTTALDVDAIKVGNGFLVVFFRQRGMKDISPQYLILTCFF